MQINEKINISSPVIEATRTLADVLHLSYLFLRTGTFEIFRKVYCVFGECALLLVMDANEKNLKVLDSYGRKSMRSHEKYSKSSTCVKGLDDENFGGTSSKGKKVWRKILYEQWGEDYEDNHVDDSFLVDLKKNAYVRSHGYWTVCKESCRVINQLSSVAFFVGIYFMCRTKEIRVRTTVFSIILILFALLYMYWFFRRAGGYIDLNSLSLVFPQDTPAPTPTGFKVIKGREKRLTLDLYLRQNKEILTSHLKSLILYPFLLLSISPILQTLTNSISSDTLSTMTAFLFLGNVLFYDYKYSDIGPSLANKSGGEVDGTVDNLRRKSSMMFIPSRRKSSSRKRGSGDDGGKGKYIQGSHFPEAALGPNHVSFNCAMSGSICLSSRLLFIHDVFALNVLCILVFVLYAYFLRFLKQNGNAFDEKLYYGMTIVNCLVDIAVCYALISPVLALVFGLTVLSIAFISPMCLLYMEQYKNEIHGPWDEAIIILQ